MSSVCASITGNYSFPFLSTLFTLHLSLCSQLMPRTDFSNAPVVPNFNLPHSLGPAPFHLLLSGAPSHRSEGLTTKYHRNE